MSSSFHRSFFFYAAYCSVEVHSLVFIGHTEYCYVYTLCTYRQTTHIIFVFRKEFNLRYIFFLFSIFFPRKSPIVGVVRKIVYRFYKDTYTHRRRSRCGGKTFSLILKIQEKRKAERKFFNKTEQDKEIRKNAKSQKRTLPETKIS